MSVISFSPFQVTPGNPGIGRSNRFQLIPSARIPFYRNAGSELLPDKIAKNNSSFSTKVAGEVKNRNQYDLINLSVHT